MVRVTMNSHAPLPSPLILAARALNLDLSQLQLDQLTTYSDLLATAAHNLVSARDRDLIQERHVAESLACGSVLDAQGLLLDGARVLDLGAGGGLPGIPLRVAWPTIQLTLLESVGKKCRFLEEAVRQLHLEGVSVQEGRAEDLARNPDHRGQYDLVVARAVAPLPVLIEYSLAFLRLGGLLAAVKGSSVTSEVHASAAALQKLGGRLYDAPAFQPLQGPSQTVVLIVKVAETPERYPRRVGVPSKRPL
jgi:16S rRNA (guanine527-N7)-methyltransferase